MINFNKGAFRSLFGLLIIPLDLVQTKTSTFLYALSFESTPKLCIAFLNQFSVHFYILSSSFFSSGLRI